VTLVLQSSDLLQAAVARLIAYVNDRGDSIGVLCGDRVYVRMAPDTVAKPYIVLTKAGSESDPEYSNLRKDIEIDALCVSDDGQEVELLGDLVEQVFLTWRISSATEGLLTSSGTRRLTAPAEADPEIRDRHELTVTGEFSVFPAPLIDALTPNGS
jgi:hypothetical protein